MTRATRLVVLLLALLAAGCIGRTTESTAPIDIGAPGVWSVHPPLPTARQEVAVAAVGGRIFVIGGFGGSAEPVATVEVYDPATNTWETRAPLPATVHHAAAAAVDGRLFVIGGYAGGRVSWSAQRTVYEYDAARNSWATRAPLLIGRGGHAAAVVGARIHVVGGNLSGPLSAHEAYDPVADRWTRLPDMPTARDHLAAVAVDGRLWAIGGRSSFVGDQYAAVEIYDPRADRWEPGVPLPVGRGGLAAAALPGRVFVFGGEAPLRIFSATEMFDVASQRWVAKEPMRTPRHGIGAAAVGGRIWIPGGGTRPGFGATNVHEAYTP